jgi:hypothetical protein
MRTRWLILATVVLGGCVADDPGPPYRAEVLSYTGFNLDEDRPRYELGVRDLGSLDDLETLDGRWFRMHRGGELVVREIDGELIDDGRFTGGDEARLRFDLEGDVLVPRDYTSLGLLSAFHEMEQVFAALEEATGVKADALTTAGRFQVFFEPQIQAESISATLKANAFFVPDARQFGLARRSSIETVPLSVDRLVLAHEVGHAVFHHLFFAKEARVCEDGNINLAGRLSHEYAIAGFNEGFADWISFAVTGATDPLASLPFTRGERRLTGRVFEFPDGNRGCHGRYYCVGTLLARTLYQFFLERGGEPGSLPDRGAFTATITIALGHTFETMRRRDNLPPPHLVVVRDCDRPRASTGYDGLVAGAFLDALIDGLPAEWQSAACELFTRNFGPEGFPAATQLTCGLVRTP